MEIVCNVVYTSVFHVVGKGGIGDAFQETPMDAKLQLLIAGHFYLVY